MLTTSIVGLSNDGDVLDLPAHEIDDNDAVGIGEGEGPVGIALPKDIGDPFDDSVASDLPLDMELDTEAVEPTVVGDDADGLDAVPMSIGIDLEEHSESLLDPDLERDGFAEEDVRFGIDSVPPEVDDGGLEGIDDPGAEQIDTGAFPELVSDADDDDDLDVGIELELQAMPALDTDDVPEDGEDDREE